MSVCYVIKNKEGKYFSGFDKQSIVHFDCDNIVNAIKYSADKYELQEIKSVSAFEDCEVVEITIAEGDIEKEIERLNKELQWYEQGNQEVNESLLQQLAEKDKEIEKYRNGEYISAITAKKSFEMRDEFEKQIRKQVCDEIRKKLELHCEYIRTKDFVGWYLSESKIGVLIDQIEKGEQQ